MCIKRYTKTSWEPQTNKSIIGTQTKKKGQCKHNSKDRYQVTREQNKRRKGRPSKNPKQLTKCQ